METTEFKNRKFEIPFGIYKKRFAETDPNQIAARCCLSFDNGSFRFKLLHREINVTWPELEVTFVDDGSLADEYEQILIARFLIESNVSQSTGKFICYTDIPWGETYSAQFNGRVIKRLAFGFGTKLDAFKLGCERIGGKAISGGDASYEIELLPSYFVRLTLWIADDEFPPSSQFLFSDNFYTGFSAEDCAVVGDIVINTLKKNCK